MRSLHLVDPELVPLLDHIPATDLSEGNLEEFRSQGMPIAGEMISTVDASRISIAGPPGAPDVELNIYRPSEVSGLLPCIYDMHGGGYIMGSARDLEVLHRQLAQDLRCVLVSVEYRLAPETRFPGAIEDCYAGLGWIFANAEAQGIDKTRIGVMGASAGGGLAASLALLARDRGEYPLAFQHLTYPMIDDRTGVTSEPHPFAGEIIWDVRKNRFGWEALLGHEMGGPDVSPYAAAARATDLANLPPTYLATAALDLFVEENMEYARRLIRAGVPTELHVYPGAFHGFDLISDSAVSRQATRDSRAALKRLLAGSKES